MVLRPGLKPALNIARQLVAALILLWTSASAAEPVHGIAMHGAVKHGPALDTLAYVNPNAPKGGAVVFGVQGSFDSLNPLIVKGVSAAGMRSYVFESLMARALDEPFSIYGLLAESVEMPEDRSSVTFTLRPEAKFSDGMPVTPADVIFSFELLRDKGRPNHRSYYKKVVSAQTVGERGVKFVFDASGDREMPLIMGLMPVLPRHATQAERFEETTLAPMIGSGPYVIETVSPGSSIQYRRNPDYWGWHVPINRGLYNFDTLRYDYYRDANSMFEAFKKGLFHIHNETEPSRWATGYDFPAVRDGRVVLKSFDLGVPAGMTGLVFNTRRKIFADVRVREALAMLFDFEWINRTFYHGLYTRTDSYFARSALSSAGRPADARERDLLAPFPGAVSEDILEGRYRLPSGDGDGYNRSLLRQALARLREAGYETRGGRLVNASTGEPFAFEMLAITREQERLFLTYAKALERAGIAVRITTADSAQYQRRKQQFDFDMIQHFWPASLSPGNEQSFRWSSKAADEEGSFNYAGVKSAAVDAMIAALLAAKDEADFTSAVRALDRVLLSGHYVVPLFHLPKQWVAHWTHLRHPDTATLYGYTVDAWWFEERESLKPSQ